MIAGLYDCFAHWGAEGTVWLYSDTHFNDADLAAGVSNRPSAEEMVKMINSKCGRKDTLIHLGDVGDISYISQLRAQRKILICGNHDVGATNYKRKVERLYFDKTYYDRDRALQEARVKYPNCRYNIYEKFQFTTPFEQWVVECDNCLFDEVYTGALMIAEKIILSHEPIVNCPPWMFNIHGHVHTKSKNDKQHFNCCCDAIGYTPINFNQWMRDGHLAHIDTIHRETIDKAIVRKRKRGGKKIGER